MANDARASVMELLLKGLEPTDIAATIGADVSYVVALQQDPTFADTLTQRRAGRMIEQRDKDDTIENLEVLALSRLADALNTETDTNKLIRAVQVLNKADRRSEGDHIRRAGTVVELQLPVHMMQRVNVAEQVDQQGQVVAVDGRIIQTLDTKTVMDRAAMHSTLIKGIMDDRKVLEDVTVDDL